MGLGEQFTDRATIRVVYHSTIFAIADASSASIRSPWGGVSIGTQKIHRLRNAPKPRRPRIQLDTAAKSSII